MNRKPTKKSLTPKYASVADVPVIIRFDDDDEPQKPVEWVVLKRKAVWLNGMSSTMLPGKVISLKHYSQADVDSLRRQGVELALKE